MTQLGSRQAALLEYVASGNATISHSGQGRMTVWDHTRDEPFPDRVVDRLFDLDMIARGDDDGPSSAWLVLTELGSNTLRTRHERTVR